MIDPADTRPIIVVERLTKVFKNLTAVNGISFAVNRGETFAFLGPNGAGKSTTIKMLITLLAPTSGGGSVDDIDFSQKRITIQHLKTRIKLSCPDCSARLSRTSKFCPSCGVRVEKAVASELEHRRQR